MKKTKYTSLLQLAVSLLAIAWLFAGVQVASATDFPGPDDYGYVGSNIAGNLRDISASGTFVPLGDDQVSSAIPIPFPFRFYGADVTDIYISANGFITFSPGQNSGCCDGEPIPNPDSPNNIIAGFWEDLNNPQGNIRYETLGSPGDQEFVVGFYSVRYYSNGLPVTFEIILHEGSDAIELQYGSAPSDGDSAAVTAGIENVDGTIGLQIANGTDVSFDNQGFLIGLGNFENFLVDKAEVNFGKDSKPDSYEIRGKFELSEFSNGIDPVNEEVTIGVGTSYFVIPPDSFQPRRWGRSFEFKGEVEGARLSVRFDSERNQSFSYRLSARGVDLTNSMVPIEVFLRIGDDLGSVTVPLYGELNYQRKKHYGHHDDHHWGDKDDHDHDD